MKGMNVMRNMMAALMTVLGFGSLIAGDTTIVPEFSDEVKASLVQAGENRAELVKALEEVPVEHRRAMQFLIAYMPASDARQVKASLLLNNVAWAYKSRETFPWAKAVPESVFFNDVLPYASLNEPRDDWREDFFHRFSPYVKGAQSQREALELINKHIVKEVQVEYNTKRKRADQSPYESMEQGMASCTGLSILLADAFRSVGIPARVAGTPAWTTKRGNHNWVEVWMVSDGAWHFTEYYMDQKGIDHGWLVADASKGNPKSLYHSIYASSWKPQGEVYFPLVWDLKNKEVQAVNVTEDYVMLGGVDESADGCELRIHRVVDGLRVEVAVVVQQGDVKLGEGVSPKPTDDMNRYFVTKVRKGQIYQVIWTDPKSGDLKTQSVTTPEDKNWCVVELKS